MIDYHVGGPTTVYHGITGKGETVDIALSQCVEIGRPLFAEDVGKTVLREGVTVEVNRDDEVVFEKRVWTRGTVLPRPFYNQRFNRAMLKAISVAESNIGFPIGESIPYFVANL